MERLSKIFNVTTRGVQGTLKYLAKLLSGNVLHSFLEDRLQFVHVKAKQNLFQLHDVFRN